MKSRKFWTLPISIVMALAMVASTLASPVDAAEITDAINDITITTTGEVSLFGGTVGFDMDWCVPDGSAAGDFFTLSLPPELTVPNSFTFDLTDPSGNVVAVATVNNGVFTFTLTPFVESRNNVCGTAFMEASVVRSVATPDETNDLTFFSASQDFEGSIDVGPVGSGPTGPRKFGRTLAETSAAGNELVFGIETGALTAADVGSTVTITDTPGPGMEIDCSTTSPTFRDGTTGNSTGAIPASDYTETCTPTSTTVTLVVTAAMVDSKVRFAWEFNVLDTTVAEYSNGGTIDIGGETEAVDAAEQNLTGGGTGNGDNEFDLALFKQLADGSNLATVAPGDTVTFTISLTNQGDTNAENITVADFLPAAGLTLADTDWTDQGDGTATSIFPGPLAPGSTTELDITFTVDTDASGAINNWAEISSADPTDGAGEVITDSSGAPLADIDSTPDADQANDNQPTGPNEPTDDEIDEDGLNGGDEDDHDVAGIIVVPVVEPVEETYSIGNQVWFDDNNNGMIDAGEAPVAGVSVELFTDTDGDGQPDDLDGDGVITSADAIATTTTDADGFYLFDGLAPADYIVGIPPTETDRGGPLGRTQSSSPTSTDPNDDVDNDDNGFDGPGGYIISGPVTLGDGEPTGEDPDNDPNTPDANENLTVDFGFYTPVVDPPPKFYSVGNQVWFDDNNNGLIDPGEAPIEGVWVELFADADGDGQPDDINGDGIIDVNDAIATTGTDADGFYLFDRLAPGAYIVGIPPMEWDAGAPLDGYQSSTPTSTNPNDDVDNDDNGTPGPFGYVWSGPVTLGDGEPTGENPDNDPNTPDDNENLTIDFGFYQPTFDLALFKQLADGTNLGEAVPGDTVTFTIALENQGETDAANVEVVDYLPAGLTLTDPDWTDNGDGTATLNTAVASIPVGTSTTVDITFTVDADASGTIDNWAEISGATDADGNPAIDIDSIPDANNDDTFLTDDDTTGNGLAGDDEDDHDRAQLLVSAVANEGTLAFTGAASHMLFLMAMGLVLSGLGLVAGGRRLRTTTID